jgi:hypothetical protein
MPAPEPALGRLRPWQRLSVRPAVFFATVTLVAVAAVGALTYQRHRRELEDTVGTQILDIARVAVLLVDPALHADVQHRGGAASGACSRIQRGLAAVRTETLLPAPVRTLADYAPDRGQARVVVSSDGRPRSGAPCTLFAHLPPARSFFEQLIEMRTRQGACRRDVGGSADRLDGTARQPSRARRTAIVSEGSGRRV